MSIVDDDCKLMPDRRYLAEVKNINLHFQRLSSSGLEGSQLTVQAPVNISQDEKVEKAEEVKMPEKKILNLKKNPKILQLIKNRVAAANNRQGASSALAFQSSHGPNQLQLNSDYATVEYAPQVLADKERKKTPKPMDLGARKNRLVMVPKESIKKHVAAEKYIN